MISQRRMILIPHKLTPQSIIIPAHLSKQYSSGHHLSNYHFIRYHYFLSKYPLTHYHLYLSKYPLIHYYHWYLSKYHPIHYYHWYLATSIFSYYTLPLVSLKVSSHTLSLVSLKVSPKKIWCFTHTIAHFSMQHNMRSSMFRHCCSWTVFLRLLRQTQSCLCFQNRLRAFQITSAIFAYAVKYGLILPEPVLLVAGKLGM